MKTNRREFLALGVGPAVALPQAEVPAPPATARACLVAPQAAVPLDITSVFRELGVAVDVAEAAKISRMDTQRYDLLWVAAPSYPEPARLSGGLLLSIDRFLSAGKGVYAEFVTNFPGLPAGDRMEKTGIARLFVAKPLEIAGALPAGTILDEHDSYSLPLDPGAARQILSFGRVRGVQTVLPGFEPPDTWPGLVTGQSGKGRFALATTSLSEFRRRQYAPAAHWERFLRELVLALLTEAVRGRVLRAYIPLRAWSEPRAWVEPGASVRMIVESLPGLRVDAGGAAGPDGGGRYARPITAGQPGIVRVPVTVSGNQGTRKTEIAVRVDTRKTAYRRALARNIAWFERSGALLAPDGSRGVAEWISVPDMEGRRIPFGAEQMFSPERADCIFESALAFWMYGKVAGSPRHRAIGERMLVHSMDFQRLERGDRGYGLWNTRGRGGPAFQDDVSWATTCSLAGYRYLRNPTFLHRGLISAKAQLAAFGPDDSLRMPLYAKAGPKAPLTRRVDEHPHSGGCVLAAWLYAYGMTGERAYLDAALPMLDDMIAGFPKIPRYIISRTCEASRFLLPLALACHYTGQDRYGQALREHAEYLRTRTAPCGAIREDGSNTGNRVEGGDLGLTYDANETVSDQLYTTSFASMNFWIAYKATGDDLYLQDYFRITDYLVRIQIESPDPMLNGGWMRGFDYSLWEYYGANADQAWSAYCMETGWTNAIIDLALALYLSNDTFFEAKKT